MNRYGAEAALRSILSIAETCNDEPDSRWLNLARSVDPAAAIGALAKDARITGPAREASEELCRRYPHGLSEYPVRIPWETIYLRGARHAMSQSMQRADVTTSSAAGAYLTQVLNTPTAAQALLAMLVLGKLGVTGISADSIGVNLPRVSGSSTPYWLSSESSQITESDLTIGQAAYSPHQVGGYSEMSRLLVLQSRPDAADEVSNDLARRVGREIERVTFAGSGVAGQPRGLSGLSGVNSVSGSSYSLSIGLTAITDTGDALTDDASPGFAANRNVASLLRQRQEFSGSPLTLWRGPLTWGQLHDTPAGSTSGIASGTAFFGCWRYLVLVDFAGGIAIDVNPFGQSNFQAGIIGLRCMAAIDVAPVWPAAFSCISGIT